LRSCAARDRRGARLPLVQRAARLDLHGRHRFARARRLLGTVAVATKHEFALAIVGGLFVLEAVSVIVQVISFSLTGKRVFRMAPLHHHFREEGLDRAADRDPLLDHLDHPGAGGPRDLKLR
jgi:hypothetical protein